MTDDRDQPIKLFRAEAGTEWPVDDLRLQFVNARKRTCSGLDTGPITRWTGLSVLVIVVLAIAMGLLGVPGAIIAVLLGASVLALLIAIAFENREAEKARQRRIVEVFVREGICPSCGYNLCNAPVTPEDGMRVCSECGSAWRDQRILRAVPFQGDKLVPFARYPLKFELWGFGAKVRDASGLWQPLVNAHAVRKLNRADAAESGRRLKAAVREIARRSRPWRYALGAGIMGLTVLIILLIAGPKGLYDHLGLTAIVVMAMVSLVAAFAGPTHIRSSTLPRAFIRKGVCPACATLLPQAPNAPGGLLACATCLSVWRPDADYAPSPYPSESWEPPPLGPPVRADESAPPPPPPML